MRSAIGNDVESQGMLPNFLCIGCPRCGTTWLHELLATHPSIVVPGARKEVHFFDQNYDNGEAWYRRYFRCTDRDTIRVKAVGEVTPHYIYGTDCPERIRRMTSVQRLIIMVRDPVDRAYSHYRWRRARRGYAKTFEDLLGEEEVAVDWGMYGKYLARFLDHFDREQILVLPQEETTGHVGETKERIAAFLGVEVQGFPELAGEGTVNEGFEPRYPRMTTWMVRAGRHLRSAGLDGLVNAGKRLVGRHLFKRGGSRHQDVGISPATEASLRELFAPDIALLERLTGLDLSAWKSKRTSDGSRR